MYTCIVYIVLLILTYTKKFAIFVTSLASKEKAFHEYYASNDPKYVKWYFVTKIVLTKAVINPPERKLAKRTFVQCDVRHFTYFLVYNSIATIIGLLTASSTKCK